jgi:hypothetical protein
LYSAASILLRSLSAAAQRVFLTSLLIIVLVFKPGLDEI